jgi:hypothetical protein
MAHDSLCFAAEGLTERFTPFTIGGMTQGMKEDENMSTQIDMCLAEIAEEYEIMQYITSPSSRLMLIWITAGVSKFRQKTVQKENDLVSKRVRFGPTKITPTHRDEPVRRPQARQIRNVKQNSQPPKK